MENCFVYLKSMQQIDLRKINGKENEYLIHFLIAKSGN